MSARPADECPYPRPFPPGFRDCPAYRSARLVPLDSRYRPLQPGRTCQHLDVGSTATAGRFYARCLIGSAEERTRWVDPERERLLADAEAITAVLEVRTSALVDRMWELKGEQLRAADSPHPGRAEQDAITAELQRLVQQAMTEMEAALEEETERLARLNLPLGTTMEFLQAVMQQWVESRTLVNPVIPDEWVERFPEQAWWLLRPRAGAR